MSETRTYDDLSTDPPERKRPSIWSPTTFPTSILSSPSSDDPDCWRTSRRR
jgi:hypothetical protein